MTLQVTPACQDLLQQYIQVADEIVASATPQARAYVRFSLPLCNCVSNLCLTKRVFGVAVWIYACMP